MNPGNPHYDCLFCGHPCETQEGVIEHKSSCRRFFIGKDERMERNECGTITLNLPEFMWNKIQEKYRNVSEFFRDNLPMELTEIPDIKTQNKIISINIENELIEELETIKKNRLFLSRSEIMRFILMRMFIRGEFDD